MSNINFDNPWLLLLAIPLIALVTVPFVWAVKKENANFHNIASFCIHLLLCVCVTLVFAGTTYEQVVTETSVYVLADVSYSAHDNLDRVDEYVKRVEGNLPKNARMGVVCFGRNPVLVTQLGEAFSTVRDAFSGEEQVDDSATDIAGALEYANGLFGENVIKRIVIISDGHETQDSNLSSLVRALEADGVYIDAVFVDNNLDESVVEAQINGVSYTNSAYVDREEQVRVTVQVSEGGGEDGLAGSLSLYRLDGENGTRTLIGESGMQVFTQGYNMINLDLPTDEEGRFDYLLTLDVRGDSTHFNDEYYFTQTVNKLIRVLFVSPNPNDISGAELMYGTDGEAQNEDGTIVLYNDKVQVTYVLGYDEEGGNRMNVPYTMEELCGYDEFVLSNLNVTEVRNGTEFMRNLDALVSQYGKSLVTLGNTFTQNGTPSDQLKALSDMLPVNYGNPEATRKSVAILIDISRSMQYNSRLPLAREVAYSIIDMLHDNDLVTVISVYGNRTVVFPRETAANKEEIKARIAALRPQQGTYIASALDLAFRGLTTYMPGYNPADYIKQVVLISDGAQSSQDVTNYRTVAESMKNSRVALTAVGVAATDSSAQAFLTDLVRRAAENQDEAAYIEVFSEDEIQNVVLSEFADEFNEVVIQGDEYDVTIARTGDDSVAGITQLSAVNGFYYSSAKASATTVLTAYYSPSVYQSFDVPLYAHWNYGNGTVASFASDLSSDWTKSWVGSQETGFLANVTTSNVPNERIDTPFLATIEAGGTSAQVKVSVPTYELGTTIRMTVTSPDGSEETQRLIYDSENYTGRFSTPTEGKYTAHITYTYGSILFETDLVFHISYAAEYNRFQTYEISNLFYMIGSNGEISEDGNLALENNNSRISVYTYDFTVPLMIFSVVLFVADIIIRKLRWADIKALFVRQGNSAK